jgi:O-Antigen ligase
MHMIPLNRRATGGKRPLYEQLGLLTRIMILVGYPAVGVLVSFVGVTGNTRVLTAPYRVLAILIALPVIVAALGRKLPGRIDPLLGIFWLMYLTRLSYDWQFGGIDGADAALLFFLTVVMVPTIAAISLGTNTYSDIDFARPLIIAGAIVICMIYAAWFLGLGFNPWAAQGVETTRLMFEALNPISVGMVSANVLIGAAFLFFAAPPKGYFKFFVLGTMGLSAVLLLVANSRGPIVACTVALAWFFTNKMKRFVYLIPFLLVALFFAPLEGDVIQNMLERFNVEVATDGASQDRLIAQKAAFMAFFDYPVLGAFYIDPELGIGYYPHNIVIETAMALGLVGLLPLLTLIFRAAKIAFASFGKDHPLIVTLLILHFLFAGLSGTLWGVDTLYMLLGITLNSGSRLNNAQRAT